MEPNTVCLEGLPMGLGGALASSDKMFNHSVTIASIFVLLQLTTNDGEFICVFMTVCPSADDEFFEEEDT